ncbi:MAG: S8 family serine peptidase [Thermoguttaceae bacterium]
MKVKQFGIVLLLLTATASVVRSQTSITPVAGKYVGATFPSTAANPGSGPPFYPSQIRQAYEVTSLAASGAGQTIAIIDAYDYPNALSTINTFSSEFGLPLMTSATFTQCNETGGTALPGTDPGGAPGSGSNWELEEAVDIEWAHALAPSAKIILYEASSSYNSDLYAAVNTARNNGAVSVVSISFGADEFDGENGNDSIFTTPPSRLAATPKKGVTFVASTGDTGATGAYPAFSPNVVAVGGTSLVLTSKDTYSSESAWSSGGGGTSTVEPKPFYQQTTGHGDALPTLTSRAIPDVSFVAGSDSPVWIYDSYNGGWWNVWGTSVAAPCWAGLIADADGIRSAEGFGTLDGPGQTLPALYTLPSSDFHDITTGNNGFPAGPGYDLATGLGTPIANTLVPDLANYQVVPEPSTAALLGIAAIIAIGRFMGRRRQPSSRPRHDQHPEHDQHRTDE